MSTPRQPNERALRKRPAQTSEPNVTMDQQVQIRQGSSLLQRPTRSDVTSAPPIPRGPQDTEPPELQVARAILDGDVLTRGELEARILADQVPALIAEKLDIEPAVVTTYEDLYFPARKLLKHKSVIIRDYCRLPKSGEFDPKDVPLLWRYIGYIMGPLPLEALLAGAPRQELRKRGLRAYLGPRSRLSPEAKYAVEARILPQPRTAKELKLLMQLQERYNA